MIGQIAGVIFPVFALVLVGYLYGRRHRPDMAAANRINLDCFIPALIFDALSARSFRPDAYLDLALGGVVVVLGSGLIALAVARLLRIPARTLVPPMMFNNSGNMGLPLALLAFGEAGLKVAIVLFIIENLMHFTLGFRILDPHSGLSGLLRIPMFVAAALGLGVSFAGILVPAPLAEAIRLLGQVSIPLMLFSLGVRLLDADLAHWRIAILGACLRPLAGVLVALGFLRVIDMEPRSAAGLVLFAALPPAVLNYMLAERYRQEPAVVAAIVIWGNLAALIVMPLTLAVVMAW